MDPTSSAIVQSWLVALGPWVLSGVIALLAWLGKRLIDRQDAQEVKTQVLDKDHAVLKKEVEKNTDDIKRHENWLLDHQSHILNLRPQTDQ